MVIEKKYKIDKEVVLDSANLYLLENGVIHIHIKIDYEVDLEIASEIAKAREILSGDVPRLILYTTEDKLLIPSPEVRDFVASEERSRLIIANATVITSLPQKLVANFFLKMDKPSRPSKFFNNEDEAMNWLLQFLQ